MYPATLGDNAMPPPGTCGPDTCGPGALPSLRTLTLALAWTLAMFSIPPLANLLNRPDLSQAPTLHRIQPAVPPALPEPPRVPEAPRQPTTHPGVEPVELPHPAPLSQPAPIQPRLSLAMPAIAGDVRVAFPLADPADPVVPVFPVAEVDTPPRPLRQQAPTYPATARQAGIEGRVDLEFVVTAEGTVRGVTVRESHPGTLFVGTATDAVRRWQFEPARHRGEPVAVRVRAPLLFRLDP